MMNLVWDRLLPATEAGSPGNRSRTPSATHAETLAAIPATPGRERHVRNGVEVSGKEYMFPANERKLESIAIEKGGNDEAVTLRRPIGRPPERIRCGRGKWDTGRAAILAFSEQPLAASGAWTGDDTYTAKICFYETPSASR